MEHTTSRLNVPEYTVAELNVAIKALLKNELGLIRVRGEISDVKKSSAGNVFFTLKGNDSFVSAMCAKGMLRFLEHKIVEGLDVVVTGEVALFNSGCFIRVTSVVRKGYGDMLQALEESRRRLIATGLLDSSKKMPVPNSLQICRVGVITSAQGAVLHDMIHRIRDRFPKEVVFYESPVQGAGTSEFIAKGVSSLSCLPNGRRPDVIIIARGGGSFEDLMPFNCEKLAVAVCSCGIPVISAIGHETDHTLLDLAADLRAPTPTAAAEFVTTPTADEVLSSLATFRRRVDGSCHFRMGEFGSFLRSAKDLMVSKVGLDQKQLVVANTSFSLFGLATARLDLFANSIVGTKADIALTQRDMLQAYSTTISTLQVRFFRHLSAHLDALYNRFASLRGAFLVGLITSTGRLSALSSAFIKMAQRTSLSLGNSVHLANGDLRLLLFRIQGVADMYLEGRSATLGQLDTLSLNRSAVLRIKQAQDLLDHLGHRLQQASLGKVLGRGFSIIKAGDKHIRSAREMVGKNDSVVYVATFHDGSVELKKS